MLVILVLVILTVGQETLLPATFVPVQVLKPLFLLLIIVIMMRIVMREIVQLLNGGLLVMVQEAVGLLLTTLILIQRMFMPKLAIL